MEMSLLANIQYYNWIHFERLIERSPKLFLFLLRETLMSLPKFMCKVQPSKSGDVSLVPRLSASWWH